MPIFISQYQFRVDKDHIQPHPYTNTLNIIYVFIDSTNICLFFIFAGKRSWKIYNFYMPVPFSRLSSECLSRTADLIDCLRRKRLRSERREIRSNTLYFLGYKRNVHTQVPLGNRLGRTCADDGFPISDTSRTLTL